MLRTIAAVVVGFLAVVAFNIAGLFLTWMTLGGEGAFAPGSTMASTPWAIAGCLVAFVAAAAAGALTSWVDQNPTDMAVKVFAGVLLVQHLVIAGITLNIAPAPMPEGTDLAVMTFAEAGTMAVNPGWYNWVIGFIGAAGALLGSCLVKRPGEGPFDPPR